MLNNAVQFFREVKLEAKKVTWPSRRETSMTTIVVFIMVTIVAMLLLAADFFISHGVQFILDLGKGG